MTTRVKFIKTQKMTVTNLLKMVENQTTMKRILTFIFGFVFTISLCAQDNAQLSFVNGVYNGTTYCFDIGVQACSTQDSFYLADQNYRIQLDDGVFDMNSWTLITTYIGGFVSNPDGTIGFYDNGDMTGSKDTIMSYNVELNGGDGILVGENVLLIGRICLNVNDPSFIGNALDWRLNITPDVYLGQTLNGVLTEMNICGATGVDFTSPLPVECATFTGEVVDNKHIALNWTTETELNNKGFIVERSTDGIAFNAIGWVDGSGTTTDLRSYDFIDENVVPNMVHYYRLVQEDLDGTKEVVCNTLELSVQVQDVASIEVFPVPTNGDLNILINNPFADVTGAVLVVHDDLGRMIMKNTVDLLPGVNRQNLDLTAVPAGHYILGVKYNNGSTTAKPIVVID